MKSSNASASAFGWDFQSNAAIMLMLKNIDIASKVKVEGQDEDVEITLTSGKKLMAQAKSIFNPDDFSNVKSKLNDGLRTLNNASQLSDVEHLYFVTNSPNPFNDATTMYKFSSPLNIIPFSELPSSCQSAINEVCADKGYGFDTALLKICVMQFHGKDDDERYKVLTSLTAEFLNRLEINTISTSTLLTLWQHAFAVNASQPTTSITKKRMIWPVIAILCEVGEEDAELAEYDKGEVSEILRKYRNIINNNSERFDFISRIISDYNEFHSEMKSKARTEKFIGECWENYKNEFDLKSTDIATEEVIIRLTIANVLRCRAEIKAVKGEVKL